MIMAIEAIDPRNGKRIKSYPALSSLKVSRKLKAAHAAFGSWRESDIAERAKYLKKAGAMLEKRKISMARLLALEMGTPLSQGIYEDAKCADLKRTRLKSSN